MILAPKEENLYTKVLCIESNIFIDKVWGDCSVKEGEWYDALIEDGSFNNLVTDDFILVRFGTGLSPYKRKLFKTESEIRDQKIKSVLKQESEEYCYYSDLPSPMAYMKKDNEE
jgi:hypothetical protein